MHETFGLDEVYETIQNYHNLMSKNGNLLQKRSNQLIHWMRGQLRRQLVDIVEKDKDVSNAMKSYAADVTAGKLTPRLAANMILLDYFKSFKQ